MSVLNKTYVVGVELDHDILHVYYCSFVGIAIAEHNVDEVV